MKSILITLALFAVFLSVISAQAIDVDCLDSCNKKICVNEYQYSGPCYSNSRFVVNCILRKCTDQRTFSKCPKDYCSANKIQENLIKCLKPCVSFKN